VQLGRLRQARKLAPIDELGPASGAEWMLAAALHDILQCANPNLDRALRRRAAARICDNAEATIERTMAPVNLLEALSRHTWLARVLDIKRTDTRVSWWTGSRSFFGVEPPQRLIAWPGLRRVRVVRSSQPLVSLAPLAIDRDRLVQGVRKLLERTPLTDIATCTRAAPAFALHDTILALIATPSGRTLALRALDHLPNQEVDAALGRATRDALARSRSTAQAALALLGDRAIARAQAQWISPHPPADVTLLPSGAPSADQDAAFARHLGAIAARRAVTNVDSIWSETERRQLLAAL
jgi:hypothetical protein